MQAQTVKGSAAFPLTQQIRNTIDVHGAEWAFYFYAERIPADEFVILWNSAVAA